MEDLSVGELLTLVIHQESSAYPVTTTTIPAQGLYAVNGQTDDHSYPTTVLSQPHSLQLHSQQHRQPLQHQSYAIANHEGEQYEVISHEFYTDETASCAEPESYVEVKPSSSQHEAYSSVIPISDDAFKPFSDDALAEDNRAVGCRSADNKKGKAEIRKLLSDTTQRISEFLVRMAESKQTRQRLSDLLREAQNFEQNLKIRLKAEIERGNNLKEDLRGFGGEEEEESAETAKFDAVFDAADVDRLLDEFESDQADRCLFVECISTGPIEQSPSECGESIKYSESSTVATENDQSVAKRRLAVKKRFDDFEYEPQRDKLMKRRGRRGRKRGPYKKQKVLDDVVKVEKPEGSEQAGCEDVEANATLSENGGEVKQECTGYKCPSCEQTFSKLYLRKQHMIEAHPETIVERKTEPRAQRTFQCSMCKLMFLRQADRNEHEENDHEPTDEKIPKEPWRRERTFKCHKCDEMFPRFKLMQKHVRDEHYAKDPNRCDVCDKTFVSRFVLKNHKKLHAPVRPFPCMACPKSYKTNGELKAHFRCHTGEKPFKCTECDEAFSNTIQRKIHMRSHTGERPPYVCSECHYEFHLRGSLVKHMRIHTGERPYLCSDCGKSFTESSGYKVHLRLHTGVRPYVCPDCGKSYVQSERLKTHLRTHTGEKRYSCTICGMRYMYSRGLRDHMEKHVGEARFACNECNRKFINEMTLGKHMRKHVKKEPTLEYFVVDGIF